MSTPPAPPAPTLDQVGRILTSMARVMERLDERLSNLEKKPAPTLTSAPDQP